ncbi:MAG: UTRA domain-containing protein [Desulfobacterales bacterium]|nr:MAG: UTRA domain-containing protein [Desulfobacterales bacterium]
MALCKQTISAVNLDAKIAKILELPENAAGIFMVSLTFDENSIPIEVLYPYHRGAKYKLEIELGRYHIKTVELKVQRYFGMLPTVKTLPDNNLKLME